MGKVQKYERVIITLCWIFVTILSAEIIIRVRFFNYTYILSDKGITVIVFMVVLIALNLVKIVYMNYHNLYTEKIFIAFRITEVIFISIFAFRFNEHMQYLLLIFPVVFAGLYKGKVFSYILIGISLSLNLVNNVIDYLIEDNFFINILDTFMSIYLMLFSYAVLVAIIHISASIYKYNKQSEKENAHLIVELGEKYEQLAIAQKEIKSQYEKLKITNQKLENSNKLLSSSIAEFYTLQQISEAIGSILDISELLKFVNDVILGVMGVNYSTIVLLGKNNKLNLEFTNITDKDDLNILRGNINCKLLMETLEDEKTIMDNLVKPELYDFIKTRKIGSFLCVPLSSKSRKFGLTLIEHKSNNTFTEENLRLLETICKQVSMAIENAELYANLQEIATIDWLTGVFNRVYFHEKFESEFMLAKDQGYNLSLVILDIDRFKQFNDTYGHLFGDVVLKSVAQTVKNCLRETDTIARFGGEEFILILPHTSINKAYELVENFRSKIASNIIKDNLISVSVTASFGIACFPETSLNAIELIRDADNALYKAKYSGRNCTRSAKLLLEQHS